MTRYYITSIVAILYIPIVTIGGELFAPFKNFFKDYFWHHWLGKGVVLILLYGLLLLLFGKTSASGGKETESDGKYLVTILFLSLISALAVFGFFVVEYIKA